MGQHADGAEHSQGDHGGGRRQHDGQAATSPRGSLRLVMHRRPDQWRQGPLPALELGRQRDHRTGGRAVIVGTPRRGDEFPIGAGSRGECPVSDDEVDEVPGARSASPEMPAHGDGGVSAHLAGEQSDEIGGRVPARRVVAHESSPPSTIAASRRMPRAMRAFTVPMGMANLVAISCWVRSPK